MRKLATLTVVAATACAPSLRVQHTRTDPGRVVGAELLGARGTDAIVFLERLSPRGFVVRSLALDDGTSQILARTEDPRDTAWLRGVHDRFGWRVLPSSGRAVRPDAVFAIDDTLLLHVDEPSGLAGYATASVQAVYGASRVTLTELVQVRGLSVGPLYRTGHHGVLVVRDGDTQSLRILDLDAARTALDNLEAVRHLNAGDLERAGALLERAVARARHRARASTTSRVSGRCRGASTKPRIHSPSPSRSTANATPGSPAATATSPRCANATPCAKRSA